MLLFIFSGFCMPVEGVRKNCVFVQANVQRPTSWMGYCFGQTLLVPRGPCSELRLQCLPLTHVAKKYMQSIKNDTYCSYTSHKAETNCRMQQRDRHHNKTKLCGTNTLTTPAGRAGGAGWARRAGRAGGRGRAGRAGGAGQAGRSGAGGAGGQGWAGRRGGAVRAGQAGRAGRAGGAGRGAAQKKNPVPPRGSTKNPAALWHHRKSLMPCGSTKQPCCPVVAQKRSPALWHHRKTLVKIAESQKFLQMPNCTLPRHGNPPP